MSDIIFINILFLFIDILFYQFMKRTTDMTQDMIYKIFDMLDFDGSGQIDFNEFYVIICILVAVKVNFEPSLTKIKDVVTKPLDREDGLVSVARSLC